MKGKGFSNTLCPFQEHFGKISDQNCGPTLPKNEKNVIS